MGNRVFYICTSLANATIGNGVTNIGNSAFGYCSSLKSITIGSGVTNVEDWAFYFCDSLTDVYYKGTETEYQELSISDGNELLTNATIHYVSCTKTTISDDNKTFTISPINIEPGKTVILALYDGDKFVEMQSAAYKGEVIPFTTSKAYTKAKVMVWNSLTDLKPVCVTEKVK